MKNRKGLYLAIVNTLLLTMLVASCGAIPGGKESHAVVKSFMEAAEAKDIDSACACLYTTADGKFEKDIEELILGNYQLFEGYQDVNMTNINVHFGAPHDTAEYRGEVTYSGGFKGWVGATLARQGEIWRLTGINIEVSQEKLADYLRRHAPVPAQPPVSPQLKLIYEDDFSNPNSGWLTESVETYKTDYKDGEYYILIEEIKESWLSHQVWDQNAGLFTDFALEVDARLVSGVGAYELVFRLKDADNFYGWRVAPLLQTYSVGKNTNGSPSFLKSRTESAFIEEGSSTNHLKVVCKGSEIEVYVNGHHLTTVTDNSFTEGYVGMSLIATEPNTRVAFDNIKVYSLD